jgi:CRP/FNR family cyclic AMP-dependent transcriptional regulator
MSTSNLGKQFDDGETIFRQGDRGDCMYVIQAGSVLVIREVHDREVILAQLEAGDFFGEMALFAKEPRSATIRAEGHCLALTVDRKTLLKRIQKDPTLALRILDRMSGRISKLNKKYGRLRASKGED